jgi:PAS domain S-box-containing protein
VAPAGASDLVRLDSLMASAGNMAYRIRLFPTPAVEYLTGAVEAITGYTAEKFYADADLAASSLHPDLATGHRGAPPELTPEHLAATLQCAHPDGTVVWVEHSRRPMFDDAGRVTAIEGIARDVTGFVKSQQRLRESEAQMRELAGRLQSAREEERAKVARELHDELGQTLTALKLEIGRAIAALSVARLTPGVVDRLQSLMGLSEIGLATVKRIATDLRPPALDHLGLAEAIRWEALAFKARSGLRCHVRASKSTTALSSEQQTAVFRIFQEALTNVARHACASAVTVTLAERQFFELRIRDNGRGITSAEASDPRAIGLIGMRERAALVGGIFRIEGHVGKGTSVLVRVPLRDVALRARSHGTRKIERASR